MSVRSAAYLYEPDQRFDANDFEMFFQNRERFESESTKSELAEDYIPDYPWLEAATRALRSRLRPHFRLVPLNKSLVQPLPVPLPSLDSGKPNVKKVTFDSECGPSLTAIRALIECHRLIREADKGSRRYEWEDLEPYIKAIKVATADFEKHAKPRPKGGLGVMGNVLNLFKDDR